MASLPVAPTKSTAARTLGSILPGAKYPASTQAIASATVIREIFSCSGVPKWMATLDTAVEMTNKSLLMRLASRQEVEILIHYGIDALIAPLRTEHRDTAATARDEVQARGKERFQPGLLDDLQRAWRGYVTPEASPRRLP